MFRKLLMVVVSITTLFLVGLQATKAAQAQTIQFSGYTWEVRTWGGGPGVNQWRSENVWVDASGYLHLRLNWDGTRWQAAEIDMTQSLGFGTYEWQIIGRVDKFDPNVVLGLFNYGPDVDGNKTNEIDIEFARWGNSAYPNLNYTVYPSQVKAIDPTKISNTKEFALTGDYSTHRFNWSSTSVFFQSFHGHTVAAANEFYRWTYTTATPQEDIPQRSLPVLINLWHFNGNPPTDNQPIEIVISKFTFTPANAATSQIALNDVTVNENAGNANVTVNLSAASSQPIQVNYATSNGSAQAGSDYNTRSGTLLFPAGTTVQTLAIPIINDAIAEGSESFKITLSNPVNASLARASGVVTIQDDDGALSGVYTIVALHSNKCIDVYGGSTSNGAKIIQWPCHGGRNQQWKIEPVGSAYRLMAVHSGKVIDVAGSSISNGAKIVQWPWTGGRNQQWRMSIVGTAYTLTAVHSGKCLTVPNDSLQDGIQLIQSTCYSTNAQKWYLQPVGITVQDNGVLPIAEEVELVTSEDESPAEEIDEVAPEQEEGTDLINKVFLPVVVNE